MRCAITGGNGFIGSYLARKLANNHDVLIIDSFAHSSPESVPPGIKYLDWDVRNYLGDVLDDWHPEIIYHLAAIAPLSECESNPAHSIEVNVAGTAQVLRYAAFVGAKFCFASSSAVYEGLDYECCEEERLSPDLMYSLGKKFGEDLVSSYRKNYGLHAVSLRFFNVFGWADKSRKQPPLVPYILNCLEENLDITLYCSSKKVVRDYIYVDDVVSAMEIVMHKPIIGATFNLCCGKSYAVDEILNTCKSFFPEYTGLVIYKEPEDLWEKYPSLFEGVKSLKKGRVARETLKSSRGSPAYANKYLGWVARYDLASGISDMLSGDR